MPAMKPQKSPNTIFHAGNRFKRYMPENEASVRQGSSKASHPVDRIIEVYASYPGFNAGDFIGYYNSFVEELSRLRYSPRDVEKASILVGSMVGYGEEEGMRAGFFLSALTNCGRHRSYTISVSVSDEPISCLGFGNAKKITVRGDVGVMCGLRMRGGEMTIEGDAGHRLGYGISGGRLAVNGEAGRIIGDCMKGGEIHIDGGYVSIAKHILPANTGKIFVGGRPVVDGQWSDEGARYE